MLVCIAAAWNWSFNMPSLKRPSMPSWNPFARKSTPQLQQQPEEHPQQQSAQSGLGYDSKIGEWANKKFASDQHQQQYQPPQFEQHNMQPGSLQSGGLQAGGQH